MKVIDAVKNTAFTAAINSGLKYLEKDPEVNIPKLMSLVDKAALEGWYEGARNMIRNAIEEKGNWYDLIMKIYQLDPGVRKNFFQNFIVNASLKGSAIHQDIMADFLRRNRAEVVKMSIYEYDEEKNYKMLQEQYWNMGHERGKSEGIAQGRAEGELKEAIRLILIKIKKQQSPEQIADFLELDLNFVKAVCQIAAPMAPDYDLDKIYEKYHAIK